MRPVSFSFAEGRYFDLWMLVHFLAGLSGGLSNVYLRLPGASVLLAGLLLMVAWELFEYRLGLRESIENRVLDIGVGLAGVGLALRVAAPLPEEVQRRLFAVSALACLVGSALGWFAYRRRRARGAAPRYPGPR